MSEAGSTGAGAMRGSNELSADPSPAAIRRRLMAAQMAAAEAAMLRGASPEEVDQAALAAGWPMGPCEADDLIGLHHGFEARRERADPIHPVADRMVREGRVGKIGGVGWHRYPGGGGAVTDPLIEDLIAEEARFAGLAPKATTDQAIARRLSLALLVAAGEIWSEGATWETIDAAAEPPFPAPLPSIRAAALGAGAGAALADLRTFEGEDDGTPATTLWRAPIIARLAAGKLG